MADSKICKKCLRKLGIDNFYPRKASKDGLCFWCKKCTTENTLNHYYKNKERYKENYFSRKDKIYKIINELKDNPCKDCGNKYPPYVMDYDHTGNDKVKSISRMMQGNYSEENILIEIKKCDLVCSNCHRIRTNDRNPTRYTRNY